MATPEEFQFTQLARLVRNIKELHSTYLVGKSNARLATETEFLRHKSTLESWLKSLPVGLRVEHTSDEARPTLNSAFIGHLHSFFCLGMMMLNRIQLPLYDPHSANEQWLRHMLLCHAAAKEQCRLYEAIIHQYGLRGVQCMQRGANFTIYCLLLCVAVHLVSILPSALPPVPLLVAYLRIRPPLPRQIQCCIRMLPTTSLDKCDFWKAVKNFGHHRSSPPKSPNCANYFQLAGQRPSGRTRRLGPRIQRQPRTRTAL